MFNRKKIENIEREIYFLKEFKRIQDNCYPTPAKTISVKRLKPIPAGEAVPFGSFGWHRPISYPEKTHEFLSLHEAVKLLINYFDLRYVDGKEEKPRLEKEEA